MLLLPGKGVIESDCQDVQLAQFVNDLGVDSVILKSDNEIVLKKLKAQIQQYGIKASPEEAATGDTKANGFAGKKSHSGKQSGQTK